MRTTLTLEDDVAARLEKIREQRRDDSLKEIVNELLRRGMDAVERGPEERERYEIKPHRLGRCRLPSLDDTSAVLAWAEGEAYK